MNISVVGTGYVGLVTGALLADRGNNVTCVDTNPKIVDTLNSGKVHIFEPGLESIVAKNVQRGNLSFTSNIQDAVESSTVHFLAVGTPSDDDGSFNLRYVKGAATDLGKALNGKDGFQSVVMKSTVPPGTWDVVSKIINREAGSSVDWAYVSNPEFLAEGSAVNDFSKPARIVIGTTSVRAFEVMEELYRPFNRQFKRVYKLTPVGAELTKLLSNTFLASRIAEVNETARICDLYASDGADMDDIRMAVCADPRIGTQFMFPGPGYGGSCFPKDVQGLVAATKKRGYSPELISGIHESNEGHKKYLAKRVEELLQVENPVIGVWGLTFKPNTDDMREAASVPILHYLLNKGATVQAYDPQSEKARAIFEDKVQFFDNEYAAAKGADALLHLTEWNELNAPDFEKLSKIMKGRTLFDFRNIWDARAANRGGFSYFGVGRNYPLEEIS